MIRNISNAPNQLGDFCTLLSELSTMSQDYALSLVYGEASWTFGKACIPWDVEITPKIILLFTPKSMVTLLTLNQ